jgi:AraC family transcriptional regulator, transcriptional activator of pobA
MSTCLPSFDNTSCHFIVNDEIEVRKLDWLQERRRFAYTRPEPISSYEFIWVKSGTGSLTFNTQNLQVSENALYCFPPGQYRKLESRNSIEGYYVSFTQDYLKTLGTAIDFSSFFSEKNLEQVMPVVHVDFEMEDILIKMQREFSGRHFLKTEILKSMLKVFLIYLSRHLRNEVSEEKCYKTDKDIARKFQVLVEKHVVTKKFVSDYADELCITPNYLNTIIKKHTGLPASRYIQRHIIMEAKRQVIYSRVSMKEVADNLGFCDYAHFSKFFKNYSGISFSTFRKQVLVDGVA